MLKFSFLQKFIYYVSRSSGFVHTQIEFRSLQKVDLRKSFLNNLLLFVSLSLSCLSNVYNAHIPIAEATSSKLIDLAVNTIIRMMIFSSIIFKIANIIQKKRFFDIIESLQWIDWKVNY